MFFYFSLQTGFDISCKLSPVEWRQFYMKCHLVFWEKKNTLNLSSDEFGWRVLNVNLSLKQFDSDTVFTLNI